jgi:ACS family pantothenate transporter-like MFS transporter
MNLARNTTYIADSASMSQPHQKAVKNAFTVAENVAVASTAPSEGDVASYKQSERTWKSYIWSCKC